jgi:hypothetical protein
MKKIILFFKYVEPIWLGNDNKISIRRVLTIAFSINLISNVHHIIYNWDFGKSYADAALLLGIEAGLITALLSLTTYSNAMNHKSHDNLSQE